MRKKDDRNSTTELPTESPLHNRVAILRMERGLSRQDLAAALGVNYQTIGYIERGEYNPSLELAFRLSELFGVPIETIFARQPFRPMSEELYASTRDGMRETGRPERSAAAGHTPTVLPLMSEDVGIANTKKEIS